MNDPLAMSYEGADSLAELALDHMVKALGFIDLDSSLPGVIGARLQHAIDTLCEERGLQAPTPSEW